MRTTAHKHFKHNINYRLSVVFKGAVKVRVRKKKNTCTRCSCISRSA